MSASRRDPFSDMEPVEELGLTSTIPPALQRPAKGRKRPIRPTEKRRAARKMTVTFSDAAIPCRLRALAEQWGLYSPGGSPNISAVIEYLLLPQLEEAERGALRGPGVWQ